MRRSMTVLGGALLVLALAVVAVVVVVRAVTDRDRTDLQRALAAAPGDSARYSWTDWAGVRRALDVDLTDRSSATEVDAFLSKGFDADLTSTSALVESARVLQLDYGFSPATLDWELFSQAEDGAVVVMQLPGGDAQQATDEAGDRLETLGYQRPDDPDGVWVGGEDLLAKIGSSGAEITPELQYVALDRDAGRVLASDSETYLTALVDGEAGTADLDESVAQAAGASGSPLSAAVYSGDYTCTALSMSRTDDATQAAAAQELTSAGQVNPVLGFVMSVQPDRDVRVAMAFETSDQARTNADTRQALASGPALGQGGTFRERFELGRVEAKDDVVTMTLDPRPDSFVLSDLSTGPLLFATC